MNFKSKTIVLPVLFMLAFTSCTPERDPASLFAPEGVGILVVDTVLIVDQPYPSVRLTRTQAPDAIYRPSNATVTDAEISIHSGGTSVEYSFYQGFGGDFGFYTPTAASPTLIQAETTYEIIVTTPQGERLSASTTTPGHFNIDQWVLLSLDGQTELRTLKTFDEYGPNTYFQPENELAYAGGLLDGRFSYPSPEAIGAAGYQVSIVSLDLDSDLVISPEFLDEEALADLPRSGSSPAIYGSDGYIRLPWFGIFYEGRHLYKTFAVDRNWFDYIRSVPETGGGFGNGANAGDGVDPPIFHVQGGIGLFASGSVDSTGFFIVPAP